MELFLGAEEALLIVIEAEEYPEEGDDTEVSSCNKRIAKAAAMINSACHMSVKPYIRHITDARKMWKTLAEKLDTTATRAGRCSLLRQFHALRPSMSAKSPFGVTEYINELTEYSNRLEGSEQAISDETFIAYLTTTLPETFKNIVDIILHQPAEEQTLTKVIATLVEWEQSEETRRSANEPKYPAPSTVPEFSTSQPSSSALYSGVRNRSSFGSRHRFSSGSHQYSFFSPSRTNFVRQRGHRERFKQRNPRAGFGREEIHRIGSQRECWYCGRKGHIQRDCFKRKQNGTYRNDKSFVRGVGHHRMQHTNSTPEATEGSSQADLAVVRALTVTLDISNAQQSYHAKSSESSANSIFHTNWIIDSGASHHLTSQRSLFSVLTPLKEEVSVTVGNGESIKAAGTGTVHFEFPFGLRFSIDALYVPGISRSLLSVSQLNHTTPLTFQNGCCYSGARRIGILRDGLYELTATPIPARVSPYPSPSVRQAVSTPNLLAASALHLPTLEMWHLRLGHLGLDALKRLLPSSSYSSSENAEITIKRCITCVQAKQQRSYNRKPVEKTTQPFHLLHSDLCGPLALSHSGYRYFILYIDDFSRSTWVYFLRSKKAEEAVSVFQQFQAMVDTQYPAYTIRRFRCDNGRGEYDNTFFRGILHVRGISFEPSPPYTQHKNGVSERMIRTISTKARSMLLDSRLEDIFWAEAVNTATYLHSRSPSTSLNSRTPYEVLNGRKPELQHLRRFGSAAHKLIPPEQRNGKFASHSRQCIMLGYVHDTSKIWRLWDPIEGRAIQASNVRFDESLIEGKRVIDEKASDTLHSLTNSEDIDIGASENESCAAEYEARPSGLYVRGKRACAKEAQDLSSEVLLAEEAKSPVTLDPNSYSEAIACTQQNGWKTAMREEFASLKENKTWEYIPAGDKQAIGCRWVFRTKINADGSARLKARLVVKGYEQIEGTNYGETYAPVAKLVSFRLLLTLAAHYNWLVHHMDVVTAFLNPPVDEEIYMEAPEGIEWLEPAWSEKKYLICKLKKSLYGLKQAPRLWYKHIDTFLRTLGFVPTNSDPNIYLSRSYQTIILLYVDDLLIISPLLIEIEKVKQHLLQQYRMSDLGPVRQFLGIEVRQIQHSGAHYWAINQRRFIFTILSRFGMATCKGVSTPLDKGTLLLKALPEYYKSTLTMQREYQTLIGSLMYLMMGTRPDLAYTISTLSKFCSNPTPEHIAAAKRVLRYLQSTSALNLAFVKSTESSLRGYSDSDWAGDKDDSKSTSGYLFTLAGATICWKSRKQKLIALSSTEAEYIGLTETAKEASWLRELYNEIHLLLNNNPLQLCESLPVFADNQASIYMSNIPRFHERTKHIGIRYHYVRTAIEQNLIHLFYIPTTENPADLLTKSLSRELHKRHTNRLGLRYFTE